MTNSNCYEAATGWFGYAPSSSAVPIRNNKAVHASEIEPIKHKMKRQHQVA